MQAEEAREESVERIKAVIDPNLGKANQSQTHIASNRRLLNICLEKD
jgi:hypothetical protein